MPGRDTTGPAGQGPMTGWGMGYCAGVNRGGYTPAYGPARGFGRGFGGRGFGRGRGFGWRWQNAGYPMGQMPVVDYGQDPQAEMRMLEEELAYLKNNQDMLKKRIEELKTQSNSK